MLFFSVCCNMCGSSDVVEEDIDVDTITYTCQECGTHEVVHIS